MSFQQKVTQGRVSTQSLTLTNQYHANPPCLIRDKRYPFHYWYKIIGMKLLVFQKSPQGGLAEYPG